MSVPNPVLERNRELARQINEEALQNPNSPYAHKCVGIANGQVVVVADDLDSVLSRLRQVEPDPMKTFALDADEDTSVVHEMWGTNYARGKHAPRITSGRATQFSRLFAEGKSCKPAAGLSRITMCV